MKHHPMEVKEGDGEDEDVEEDQDDGGEGDDDDEDEDDGDDGAKVGGAVAGGVKRVGPPMMMNSFGGFMANLKPLNINIPQHANGGTSSSFVSSGAASVTLPSTIRLAQQQQPFQQNSPPNSPTGTIRWVLLLSRSSFLVF